MKQTIKIILSLIVLAIAGYIIGGLLTNKPTTRQLDLQKLDKISTRLAYITERQEVLSGEIYEREMEYFYLNSEAIRLNEEATEIFINNILGKETEEPKTQCDALIEQELNNIKLGIQTKEGFIGLVAGAGCEYDGPFPETEWYPGKLTEDGSNQEMPVLTGTTSHERFKELMSDYGLDPKVIREVEEHYGITEGVIGCITIAETSGGKNGAGVKNIGNVGNTDSNPRGQSYSNLGASLDAIGRTLVNKNLGKKQTLGCLSNWHHCEEPNDNGMRYATSSPETSGAREPNMVVCLDTIYGEGTTDPATFNIRTR